MKTVAQLPPSYSAGDNAKDTSTSEKFGGFYKTQESQS
jgi:hypothetical protein